MAGLVVAGLTTWQYEGTTAKKKHEHRISYLTGGGLLMEGQEARPTKHCLRQSSGAGLLACLLAEFMRPSPGSALPGLAADMSSARMAKFSQAGPSCAFCGQNRVSGGLFRENVALDPGLVDGVEVETILYVQPVLRRRAKVAPQARGRVRRDAAFLVHDQADAVRRHADRLRQSVNADLFILHVLEQDFARVKQWQLRFAFSGSR